MPSNLNPPLADAAAEFKAVFLNGCLRNVFELGQPECATGDTASTTTVALVGDSNATMWNPALQQIAAQRHWRLETLDKGGCPLMNLPITDPSIAGVHRIVRAVARSDHRPVTGRAPTAGRGEHVAGLRCRARLHAGFSVIRPGVARQC